MGARMNEYVMERLSGPEAMGRTYSRELSIDSIFRQGGHAVVGSEGLLRQERSELPSHRKRHFEKHGQSDADTLLDRAGVDNTSRREFYRLSDDEIYYVLFEEAVEVPEGHVGIVSPQETMLRAGIMMDSSLMGPEEDSAEALLTVEENSVLLQASSSIAELLVFEPTPVDDG